MTESTVSAYFESLARVNMAAEATDPNQHPMPIDEAVAWAVARARRAHADGNKPRAGVKQQIAAMAAPRDPTPSSFLSCVMVFLVPLIVPGSVRQQRHEDGPAHLQAFVHGKTEPPCFGVLAHAPRVQMCARAEECHDRGLARQQSSTSGRLQQDDIASAPSALPPAKIVLLVCSSNAGRTEPDAAPR